MNTLNIVTSEYPFGKQETFLETEIVFLSHKFDRIYLYPSKTTEASRPVPENVEVRLDLANQFDHKFRKLKSVFTLSFVVSLILNFRWLRSIQALKRINTYNSELMAITSFLRKGKAYEKSIWYTYWFNGFTYGLCRYFVNDASVVIVSRGHRYDVNKTIYKPAFIPFWEITISRLNKLYLISTFAYDLLAEQSNKSKIEVARLGVLPPRKRSLQSLDSTFRIVTVSNLVPVKRIYELAKYLVNFSKLHSDIKIDWTHFGDGFLMEDIINYLKKNKLHNLVYNFRGRVPNKEVLHFYTVSYVDLFLNVSESEGIPVSIMEAISFGIPVLATDVGGNSEIVNDRNGKLIPMEFEFQHFEKALLDFVNKAMVVKPDDIVNAWSEKYNATINYQRFAEDIIQLGKR